MRRIATAAAPATLVMASADAMFSYNRVEQPDNRSTEAVRITSPVVLASANRVRGGEISVNVTNPSRSVAAVGNVTTGPIFVGGNPLPAPYDAFNVALNLFG